MQTSPPQPTRQHIKVPLRQLGKELIHQCYELPAFSTLDRLAGRVRALVYGRIYRTVQSRMTAELQQDLEKLLEVQLPSYRSTFSQLKQVPQSPTLSHLKAWQDRLTWLMDLGSMEPLLKDIPSAIVKHFAAEARALMPANSRIIRQQNASPWLFA